MDKLRAWALLSSAQTIGAGASVLCAGVYGNDIAVKPDLRSPLPPAYWVVCFAECLLKVAIIEILLDGQLDALEMHHIFND